MSNGVQLQPDNEFLKAAGRSTGWLRLGESSIGAAGSNFLLVHAGSDGAEDCVASLAEAGIGTVIWQLDLQEGRKRRQRRKEIERIVEAGAQFSGPWVAIAPFTLVLARELEKLGGHVRLAVLSDDLAALWSGAEASHASSLSALRKSASDILDLAVFIGSSHADRMVISTRKAKEFPRETITALLQFFEIGADPAQLAAGAGVLGRLQPLAPRVVAPHLTYQPAFKWGVDSIFKRGVVCGWVKRAMSNERVAVRVIVEGQEVATASAEYFRQQLFDLGVGDGAHSFAIDISANLGQQPKRVEIRTVDGDVLLGEAMMTASVGQRIDETIADVNLAS